MIAANTRRAALILPGSNFPAIPVKNKTEAISTVNKTYLSDVRPWRNASSTCRRQIQTGGLGDGEVFGLNKRGNFNCGNLNLWGDGVTIGVGVAVGDASVVAFFRAGFGFGEVAGASDAEGSVAVSACEFASAFLCVRCFVGDADCVGVPVKSCDSTRPTQMVTLITRTNGTALALIQQILKAVPFRSTCSLLFLI